MLLRIFLAFTLGFGVAGAIYYFLLPVSDATVREQIEKWYKKQEAGYTLEVSALGVLGSKTADTTAANKNLIKFDYQGMQVALEFARPVSDIAWHKDSLQAYFSAIAIDKIYHRIPSDGWELALTRSTSADVFVCTAANEKEFSFELTSKIEAIKAISNASHCKTAREAAQVKMPEDCALSVEKIIPFRLVGKIARPK
jgi:hypothetical protein